MVSVTAFSFISLRCTLFFHAMPWQRWQSRSRRTSCLRNRSWSRDMWWIQIRSASMSLAFRVTIPSLRITVTTVTTQEFETLLRCWPDETCQQKTWADSRAQEDPSQKKKKERKVLLLETLRILETLRTLRSLPSLTSGLLALSRLNCGDLALELWPEPTKKAQSVSSCVLTGRCHILS